MKRILRVMSLTLSMIILIVSQPVYTKAETMSAADYWATANSTDPLDYDYVRGRIDTIISNYLIPGRYWNHVGLSEWDKFTTTDRSCDDFFNYDGKMYPHNYAGFGGDVKSEYGTCNAIIRGDYYYSGCYGFSELIWEGIYGTEEYADDYSFVSLDDICIGDLLNEERRHDGCLSYLEGIVVDIDGDDITILTCGESDLESYDMNNETGENEHCLISLSHRSISQLKNTNFTYGSDWDFWSNWVLHNNRNMASNSSDNSDDNNDVQIDFDQFKAPEGCVFQYRLYNPNNGEHFYTGSREETLNLVKAGWTFEGAGFISPTVGDAIYRLYNSEHGDHLYTRNVDEKNMLEAQGWTTEGIAFPSADENFGRAMYRLHNPNAWNDEKAGAWHFTMSEEERDNLINLGWEYEGVAWYSV